MTRINATDGQRFAWIVSSLLFLLLVLQSSSSSSSSSSSPTRILLPVYSLQNNQFDAFTLSSTFAMSSYSFWSSFRQKCTVTTTLLSARLYSSMIGIPRYFSPSFAYSGVLILGTNPRVLARLLFLPILRGPTVGTHDTHRGLKNGTNKKIVANSIIVGNTNSMNRSRIPSLVADDAYQLKFEFSVQSLTRRYTTRWHSGLRKTIILVLFDPMRQ